jgi:ferritin-like metal-binding protein YciE
MATMDSLHDVFVHELRDLYSAERQLIKALPKMAKNAGSPELADALTNHLNETKAHVTRLEEILQTLGVKSGGVKCKGMEGLIEEGAEVLEMDGEPGPLDAAMIGAAQRVEHYEIAAYGTAISHARAQGHTEAVRLLEETLKEERNADEVLTEIARKGMADVADTSTMGEAIDMAFPKPPVRADGKTTRATTKATKKNGKARATSRTR